MLGKKSYPEKEIPYPEKEILANWFALLLPQVINEEQFGFVKERQIHESIALTQEMIGDIDRKIESGNVVLNFDMAKAYDHLKWRFLLRALREMGFFSTVQDLVYRSVSDIKYKIGINGEFSRPFRSTRGVMQGNPLSLLLFILAQQVFSTNLKAMEQSGVVRPFVFGRRVHTISHLLFANDMLVFTNGRVRSLRNLMNMLQSYERSSGQCINLGKSYLYVSKHIKGRRHDVVTAIVECSLRQLPFTYLGAPIFKGRVICNFSWS